MKRQALLLGAAVVALYMILGMNRPAWTAGIANVTIPFSGVAEGSLQVREIIAAKMKSLLPDAASAGITNIHLQSVAYSLAPSDKGYAVDGNLFIDVVPEAKTDAFVTLVQRKGTATINYFQSCMPR